MLPAIEKTLNENGLQTQRITPEAGQPPAQLGVALGPDAQGRPRTLWITPLPDPDGRLAEGLALAQFFVELPFRPAEAAAAAVGELMLALNNFLPLGAFGLRRAEGALFYRSVLLLGSQAAETGAIGLEAVLLSSHLVEQFSGALESVALGRQSPAQAAAELGLASPAEG